ncbi:MAG: hypothetical protein K9M01_03545 [Candidatus Omnitrophica bacterium]|nr:hypothetical protein [Candidatus Omnitrophota bacterium]MCF7888247.1 hypothetical protein [Candidatus Omnitrophota bacterium]
MMKKLFLEHYKKLKKQEKILVIAFAAVIFFSGYFKFIYSPLSAGIKNYRVKIKELSGRLKEEKLKLPKADSRGDEILALEIEKESYSQKLKEIKSKMPSQGNISGLIGEFSHQAKGIELLSLRQKIESKGKQPRLFIEMKFRAPYKNSVNYINRLETISPLLKINKAELTGSDKTDSQLVSQMVFSIPVSNSETNTEFRAKKIKPLFLEEKNVFGMAGEELAEAKTKDFQLDGITFNFRKPTAIINGKVVTIDSRVDGFRVKKIVPESVVLTDGEREFSLVIKR